MSFVHMGKPKALVLEINSGENKVQSAQIFFKSMTAGLRIHAARKTDGENLKSSAGTSPGELNVTRIHRNTTSSMTIPYDIETNTSALKIRLEIFYTTDRGIFSFLDLISVDVHLLLDINVQDVFKSRSLFSKFFIAATGPSPLYIMTTSLKNNDCFRVSSGMFDSEVFPVTLHNPGCKTYQITVSEDLNSPNGDGSHVLPLTIEYQSVLEMLLSRAVESLRNAVNRSELRPFVNLLAQTLKQSIEENITPESLELAALTQSFEPLPYTDSRWDNTLNALPAQSISKAEEFLKHWHQVPIPSHFLLPKPLISNSPHPSSTSRPTPTPLTVRSTSISKSLPSTTFTPRPSPSARTLTTLISPQTHPSSRPAPPSPSISP